MADGQQSSSPLSDVPDELLRGLQKLLRERAAESAEARAPFTIGDHQLAAAEEAVLLIAVEFELRRRITAPTPRRDPLLPQRRKRIRRIGVGIILLGAVLFGARVGYQWLTRAEIPMFNKESDKNAFARVLQSPPGDVYGSSINIWVYRGEGSQADEIEISGHADAETCRWMTGETLNAFLSKHDEAEDLFVAGAGRLVRREDEIRRAELEESDAVIEYLDLAMELRIAQMVLVRSALSATETGTNQSALAKAKNEVGRLEMAVAEAEKQPEIVEYRRNSATGEAFEALLTEASKIARKNDLVRVHYLPAEVLVNTRDRIRKAVLQGDGGVLRFDDELAHTKDGEGVVLQDMLQVPSGNPVELDVDGQGLTEEDFEIASKMNRADIEVTMVGDARRRESEFQATRRNLIEETDQCNRMSAWERSKFAILTDTLTPEGVFKAQSSDKVRWGEYCDIRLPQALGYLEELLAHLHELQDKITEDKTQGANGKVAIIDQATLIDSMLRGWDLPVARSQEAFEAWRSAHRQEAWNRIIKAARGMGIANTAFGGEDMVFKVSVGHGRIIVRPVHVIDLARSIVIADRQIGATRTVNAWSKRSASVTLRDGKTGTTSRLASQLIQKAISAAGAGDMQAARASIRKALVVDARGSIEEVVQMWLGTPGADANVEAKLRDANRPRARAVDFLDALSEFESDPEAKEDPFAGVESLREFLNSRRDSPPELDLRLLLETGYLLAAITDLANANGKQNAEIEIRRTDPWDVVETYSVKDPNDAVYHFSRVMAAKKLREDPADTIRETVERLKEKDPAYWTSAKAARGHLEEHSSAWSAAAKMTESKLTPFEGAAVRLEQIIVLLQQRADALAAATVLWNEHENKISSAVSYLESAMRVGGAAVDPSLAAARKRLGEIVSRGDTPDTLARVEIGSLASNGATRLAAQAHHILTEAPPTNLLRDYASAFARVAFESNEYGDAIELLFQHTVPVARYSSTEEWEVLNGEWEGPVSALSASVTANGVVVRAAEPSGLTSVVRLYGLSAADAVHLATAIEDAGRKGMLGRGSRISDRILCLQVELPERGNAIRTLLDDPEVRLMFIKGMVYGDSPPASDLVPGREATEAGNDGTGRRNRGYGVWPHAVVTDFTIPTLGQLQASNPSSTRGPH